MRLRSRTSAALCAAALLVLPACSGGDDDSSSDERSAAPADAPRYVALGDSYTAGPSINPVDGDSGQCARSSKNYPSLLAEELEAASFTDVSCSGATSDNILQAVPIPGTTEPVPAQLDAVDESTSLVTVGIGGNDDGLFASLAKVCVAPGEACGTYLSTRLPKVLAATTERVTTVLDAVEQKAPEAEVLLVGYLRVTADGQSCEVLGGSGVDTSGVAQGEKQIDAALAKAAQAAGVTYVSLTQESEDHNACSDDPWTNGLSAPLGDGITLHPNAEGMEAVADAVADVAGQES